VVHVTKSSDKVNEIADACRRHGSDSIILLSGVAGTGKTHLALGAAIDVAGHPAFVRQVQFHPSYTYEDFIEGLRPTSSGGFAVESGVFTEWNDQALADPANRYVLLVEELSRANVNSVIGELMTYLEHRGRQFVLPLSRRTVTVAPNLVILATMNPRDRSALEIDDALIRRLRIIDCPPDNEQLREMLVASLPAGDPDGIVSSLETLFEGCRTAHPDTYETEMPFGHGMFAGVRDTHDLVRLWSQRIKHLLRRPLVMPHPFAETIESMYPWKPTMAAAASGQPQAGATPATLSASTQAGAPSAATAGAGPGATNPVPPPGSTPATADPVASETAEPGESGPTQAT
jgi:hypothetical protein